MRIYPHLQSADAKEISRQGELAFTMIEIAIAIGVIGFALVAIIGILPTGLDVQKDNREDTLVSQDAPYFLDAIKNGATVTVVGSSNYIANSVKSLDFLTNYVQSIQFQYIDSPLSGSPTTNLYTYNNFTSGAEIIGLLSTPQYNFFSPYFASNYFDTVATVRALSGPATEQQTGANTGLSSAVAFTYQMEVMITPFNSFAPFTTNYTLANPVTDPLYFNQLYTRWVETTSNITSFPTNLFSESLPLASGGLMYNLFDVRLRFSWPVLANGKVGPGRQTYRTLIASQMSAASTNGVPCWFFQPQTYATGFPVPPGYPPL